MINFGDDSAPRKTFLRIVREPPIAEATIVRGFARLRACPFCGEQHLHAPSDGHRIAHCSRRVPGADLGYVVKIVEEAVAS